MSDEIKALREEVAKLRERVAVLEAGRNAPVTYPNTPYPQPFYKQHEWLWHDPVFPPGTITC